MAVAIRLRRTGKRSQPNYRIVVIDKRKKRNGLYLERIGLYNPMTNPATISIDKEKFKLWLSRGAIVSSGLNRLLDKKLKKDLSL